MDTFLKQYKEIVKPIFAPLGFKFKGQNCLRVTNDVVQSFCLSRSRWGRACRVTFDVLPLCAPIDSPMVRQGIGIYDLSNLPSGKDWWEYAPDSPADVEGCIRDMVGFMERNLLPFFQKTESCQEAYPVLCKLLNDNGILVLDDDCWQEDACYIALKRGEKLDVVLDFLRSGVEVWAKRLNAEDSTPESDQLIQSFLTTERSCIAAIESGDKNRLQEEILKREARSASLLKDFIIKNV